LKLESELKFPVEDRRALRGRIRALGFRVAAPRRLESNWLFNSPAALLRLRRSGSTWRLTAKGPRRKSKLKQRPEAEVVVSNGAAVRDLLALLGYRETFAYALHRTVFRRLRQRGELAWDETPFGIYLEIEGSPAWVLRTARALGLDPARAEPRSYPELFARITRSSAKSKRSLTRPAATFDRSNESRPMT